MVKLWNLLREAEWFISLSSWLKSHWSSVAAFLTTVPLMTYLASMSDWMNHYGPISWVLVSLLGFLLVSWGFAAFSWSSLRNTQKHILSTSFKPNSQINPMDSNFHNMRFGLNDLAHPVDKSIQGKVITNCEIIGPGVLILGSESTVGSCHFRFCDFIKFNPMQVYTGTLVDGTKVLNSKFYQLTILVHGDSPAVTSLESMPGFPGWLAVNYGRTQTELNKMKDLISKYESDPKKLEEEINREFQNKTYQKY